MNQGPTFSAGDPRRIERWIRDLSGAARRDWWLMLLVVVVVVAATMAVTLRQPDVYESTATLLFQEESGGLSLASELGPMAGAGAGGGTAIETEMAVLRSRKVAEAVVDSLDLHVSVLEPERPRSSLLSQVDAQADAPPATYELVRDASGGYRASELPGQPVLRPGEPARLGALRVTLSPQLAADPVDRIVLSVQSVHQEADRLREQVGLSRPDPRAQVLAIAYRSDDPELAAQVPNTLAASFIAYRQRTSQSETGATVEFLREQVAGYDRDLAAAEATMQRFRERNQVISLEDEATEQVSRLAELQAMRDELRAESQALRALLGATQSDAGSGDATNYRQLASFPAFFSNKAVQDILSSLTQMENERAELLIRRTPENIDVRGIETRIGELERQLFGLARNYLAAQENQLTSIEETLSRFGVQLAAIPAREIEFARLLRQQELLAEIYTMLQTRLKETEIQNASQSVAVRILDPALIPQAPIAPRPMFNLLLGLLAGSILAAAILLIRYLLDPKVRSTEDAVEIAALPLLGEIPRLGAGAAALSNGHGGRIPQRRIRRLGPAEVSALAGAALVTEQNPLSPVPEAYRAVRTSLALVPGERPVRVVLVTSAAPGDGKTLSAVNLALSFVEQGLRTVLIDADLRRGSVHRVLNVETGPGLVDVLDGVRSLDEALQGIKVERTGKSLDVLSSGGTPPNPAELVGSEEMRSVLEELRRRYDVVVVDAAPLNLVSDAALLARAVDAGVLVARIGSTDKQALGRAAERLRAIGIRFGGLVVNDTTPDQSLRYEPEHA